VCHGLHFCQQRIDCTCDRVLHASLIVSNRTGLIDFAGDAPPSIERQSQSLLYLFSLLGWFCHPRQRILHDEEVKALRQTALRRPMTAYRLAMDDLDRRPGLRDIYPEKLVPGGKRPKVKKIHPLVILSRQGIFKKSDSLAHSLV
jgi:hypothetical protein